MKDRLSNQDPLTRRTFVAMLMRNQFAVDYFGAAISSIPEHKNLYKREVKMLYNNCKAALVYYNTSIRNSFLTEDAYEILLDKTYEFHEELKQSVAWYEEALSRLLGRTKMDNIKLMSKLSMSKDLLDLCAYIGMVEANYLPSLRGQLEIGGIRELQYMCSDPKMVKFPSVMGHITKLCGRLNKALLTAMGKTDIFGMEFEDNEAGRAMEIAGAKMQYAMTNYELISAMFAEGVNNIEEAKELVAERTKEREMEYAKAKAKKAHREQIKKAKQETKNK